jgi:signal-transduction protein with cAMP-binding, CBS, and nucleotidyltransferase domain
MRVSELKPRDVVTVSKAESLRGAAKLLNDDEVGALLVIGATDLDGVFSERDLSRAVADGVDLDDSEVCEYMTPAPVTVQADSYLGEVISDMNEFAIRHVVVMKDGEPLGMVSMRDVVALLGTRWPEL